MIVPREEVAWGGGMPAPLHDTWLRRLCTATILFFPLLNVIVVGLRVYGRVTMKQFGIGRLLCALLRTMRCVMETGLTECVQMTV